MGFGTDEFVAIFWAAAMDGVDPEVEVFGVAVFDSVLVVAVRASSFGPALRFKGAMVGVVAEMLAGCGFVVLTAYGLEMEVAGWAEGRAPAADAGFEPVAGMASL